MPNITATRREYGVARVYELGYCGLCRRDRREVANITIVESGGSTDLFMCANCASKIASLRGARNRGKELFNGVVQDR